MYRQETAGNGDAARPHLIRENCTKAPWWERHTGVSIFRQASRQSGKRWLRLEYKARASPFADTPT